jgi:DNA polymerase eta
VNQCIKTWYSSQRNNTNRNMAHSSRSMSSTLAPNEAIWMTQRSLEKNAQAHVTPTTNQSKARVVLLLDLDCFYAQCECVRLGWDAMEIPLALLQWDSVLAVTYPARKYGIKRGDSWDTVHQKSQGACYAVHVPILTTNGSRTDRVATLPPGEGMQEETPTLHQDYERIFCISQKEQSTMRQNDVGRRRRSSDGKACIERYRIASATIFATVLAWVENQFGDNVVLERASIDEFFLDVTNVCYLESTLDVCDLGSNNSLEGALQETAVVGQSEIMTLVRNGMDVDVEALQRGAHLARCIRDEVRTLLGFTLSAGIGSNKTIAKLSAAYGKPNGQAITYPQFVDTLLADTEIRKCRNLGGKLGKTVQALLPADAPTTVHSIAKYLSLPTLEQHFEAPTAAWVYRVARGVDTEPVASKNESALTKSITAFKSLPFDVQGHDWESLASWIRLLADEIVSRVERDASRNGRYPKSCTIQYAGNGTTGQRNKSIRVPFPAERLSKNKKIDELCGVVPKTVQAKENSGFRLRRIGLCAIDFRNRPASGIDRFFCNTCTSSQPKSSKGLAMREQVSANVSFCEPLDLLLAQATDEHVAGMVQTDFAKRQDKVVSNVRNPTLKEGKPVNRIFQPQINSDKELAEKLQSAFDRENQALEALDRKAKTNLYRKSKARKIDDLFFTKR